MPLRLSELLERIRPAGAPGAPTEGEQQREEFDRASEMAEIAAVLAGFEEEANERAAVANAEAAKPGRDAEREARRIRSAIPDRVATVQAAAAIGHGTQGRSEQTAVAEETAKELARLTIQGEALIPDLVAAATDIVWAMVKTEMPNEAQS